MSYRRFAGLLVIVGLQWYSCPTHAIVMLDPPPFAQEAAGYYNLGQMNLYDSVGLLTIGSGDWASGVLIDMPDMKATERGRWILTSAHVLYTEEPHHAHHRMAQRAGSDD